MINEPFKKLKLMGWQMKHVILLVHYNKKLYGQFAANHTTNLQNINGHIHFIELLQSTKNLQ